MHQKAAIFQPEPAEPLGQTLPVDDLKGVLVTQSAEGVDGGVGGGQVRHLTRAAAETAFGTLTQTEKIGQTFSYFRIFPNVIA